MYSICLVWFSKRIATKEKDLFELPELPADNALKIESDSGGTYFSINSDGKIKIPVYVIFKELLSHAAN